MNMNRYDVEDMYDALRNRDDVPNLQAGARTLMRLMQWTDSHSDGWPYWAKPGNASARLQDALHDKVPLNVHGVPLDNGEDITLGELKRLLSPIKAFLTRQGVDYDEVIWLPERTNRQRTRATVSVTLDLPVEYKALSPAQRRKYDDALSSLASIMHVQAEDGLYLAGNEDAEVIEIDGVEVQNEFVSEFVRTDYSVHLSGYEASREEVSQSA